MKEVTVFINWETRFVTIDKTEAIEEYLRYAHMTIEEYAINENIIAYLDKGEELSDYEKDHCYKQIFDDMDCGIDSWFIAVFPAIS